jgi:menaquinone-specific isochorismate synthase
MGGIGIADEIKGDHRIDYQELFRYMKERLSNDNPHLRYYGGMRFDPFSSCKEWQAFGTYQFMIPQFELFRSNGQMIFAFNIAVDTISTKNIEDTISILNQIDFSPTTTYRPPPKVLGRNDFPDKKAWDFTFARVLNDIHNRQFEKIVLARKSAFKFDVALRSSALMKHLKDRTPNCFHFIFQPSQEFALLGASPERLYKKEKQNIWSEAIAGTRPRGRDDLHDLELENELLNSNKDADEHRIVVEMIHEALAPLCHTLTSENTFNLQKLNGSQHLITRLEGALKDTVSDDQLLECLHPTPAVGGWPTLEAIKAIKTHESFDRGWYAGPIGYVGNETSEFAVAIRSGLIDRDQLSLYAGAGIVSGSSSDSEWDEIENKISKFIDVFNIKS